MIGVMQFLYASPFLIEGEVDEFYVKIRVVYFHVLRNCAGYVATTHTL